MALRVDIFMPLSNQIFLIPCRPRSHALHALWLRAAPALRGRCGAGRLLPGADHGALGRSLLA